MPKITFLPSKKTRIIEPGKTILEAARSAGINLPVRCGGKGTCGKCRVRIVEGDCQPGLGREAALSKDDVDSGWCLACITKITGDLVVEVPEVSTKGLILTDFGETAVELKPNIQAFSGSIPVLDEEGGRPSVLGLAVDVGTTTVAGVLVDLLSGEDLATASRPNPQATHGDDILSRIDYAGRGANELSEMQRLITQAIDEIAAETTSAAGKSTDNIYEIVAAGNTTMHHLLLGIDPSSLGVIPFLPARREALSTSASKLGIKEVAPKGKIYVAANISGYLGGDITVGLEAHHIHEDDRTLLYLDVGTNGEVVLRSGGVTYGCSTAAGPAFEGARISCGMCATSGAVNYLGIDKSGNGDLIIQTVGDAPVRGICGTGLVDAVAALLELGIVDETGRLLNADELPDDLPEAVRQRLDYNDTAPKFILSSPEVDADELITLTARDLREMQLAKAAIAAGIDILMNTAGISPSEFDEVLLAGAFGSFLRPESARRVGLLPAGLELGKVRAIGNAALAGARAVLLNQDERDLSEALSLEVKYIELSSHPDFQTLFVEALQFPNG